MIDDLVIHDSTKKQLDRLIANPAQTVLVTGPAGIGKGTVALGLISTILGVSPTKLSRYANFKHIAGTDSISIEAIRELKSFLVLKTSGQGLRRAVLIEYADLMTTEAQNAFLKLLEEPPLDTLIVLTANSRQALLPTILSRLAVVALHPPSQDQTSKLMLGSSKPEEQLRQAYHLSGGLPGLLHALVHDQKDHPLLGSVLLAKEVLQKSVFERLSLVDGLSKQKHAARDLIQALERVAQAGLVVSAGDLARINRWHQIRKAAVAARQALQANANQKLVLDNLLISLG